MIDLFIQIWRVAQDGTNIQVLLDEENGIQRPTWIHSDDKCEQFTVINKGGQEIRNYNIHKVTRFSYKTMMGLKCKYIQYII